MPQTEKANLHQVNIIRQRAVAFRAAMAKVESDAILELAAELYLTPEVVGEYWEKLQA